MHLRFSICLFLIFLACGDNNNKETFTRVEIEGSPVRGSNDAWVTVVQFDDFECSYCRKAEVTLAELETKYGDDLRLVFKHFPLSQIHPHALPAAKAAQCAFVQNKFWEMSDLLFSGGLEDEDFTAYAVTLGMDLDAFNQCLSATSNSDALNKIEADRAQGLNIGVSGTPCFFINGYLLLGAQSIDSFSTIIDRELAKARSSGIAAADYYNKAVLGK